MFTVINLGGNTFFNAVFFFFNTDPILALCKFIENLVKKYEWIYSWTAKVLYTNMYINTQAVSQKKMKQLYSSWFLH